MIPRLTNPHSLVENTQIVSRTALDEVEGEDEHPKPDLSLVDEFHRVMKRTLPALEEGRKKRRNFEIEEKTTIEELMRMYIGFLCCTVGCLFTMWVAFRLISHGPPIHISLEPKPVPYLK